MIVMLVFSFLCFFVSGSFVVLNSETMEELASFHHRKEEISDIKFSPGTSARVSVSIAAAWKLGEPCIFCSYLSS